MVHQFNIQIAQKYGVDEAIVIHNLAFWIKKNKSNEVNYKEGSYWTYNTLSAFGELFPYWTKRQISRILSSLETKKVIKSAYLHVNPGDRTKWYCILDKWVLNLYEIQGVDPYHGSVTSISPNRDTHITERRNVYTDRVTTNNKQQINKKYNNFVKNLKPTEWEKIKPHLQNLNDDSITEEILTVVYEDFIERFPTEKRRYEKLFIGSYIHYRYKLLTKKETATDKAKNSLSEIKKIIRQQNEKE